MLKQDLHKKLARYALMVGIFVITTLLLWWLRSFFSLANTSLIYILAVLVTAVWLGTGPSLAAALISFLGSRYFLAQPYFNLAVANPQELVDLFVFLLIAVIAGQVGAFARNQATAARIRATEQNILYNLAASLNRLPDKAEILDELKKTLHNILPVSEIDLLPNTVTPSIPDTRVASFVLLEAGSTIYGTLRVGLNAPLTASQSRLLTALTAQAALAMQRVDLAELAQHGRSLAEADSLKTAILRAVSHDLRTPITIIKTSVGNLLTLPEHFSSPQRHEMLQAIDGEADTLNKLVGDLLDMSRLQAGALVLHKEWYSLAEVAGEIAAEIYQRHGEKRIHLEFPDDLPLVCYDYALIMRALSNITENALRYELKGSLVVLEGAVAGRQVVLRIINHGPTIPDAEKWLIMEPFYQGNIGGQSGLGLAIAKGIVEAHNGRIQIEDTPGGGATFSITFPSPSMKRDDANFGG